MITALVTLLVVLICAYDYYIKSSRVWRHLLQFPGEPALPLLGNALQLGSSVEDVQKNLKRIWEKHGRKNFRVMFGTEPMLMVCEVETAKKILSSNTEIQKSDQHIRMLTENFGTSLVNSSGERWRTMRKILTPSFHFKLLEQYLDVANSEGSLLVDKLSAHAGGPAFNIHDYILPYSMDVICRTTLGIDVRAQSGGEQEYVTASRKILPLAIRRFYSTWYRYDFFYRLSSLSRESRENTKRITDALDRILNHRRSEFEKHIRPNIESEDDVVEYISRNRSELTFVDVMLMSKMPDGSPISHETIREEANLIIFGGFDTTLTSICFALSNLAKYKNFQQKAYEEQLQIFGEDCTREPTLTDLNSMKYLQRFIKESMRMYPTLAQYGRHIKHDMNLDDGKVIAGGTNLIFFVPGLHHNPDYFPAPATFEPDRFLDTVPNYMYLPFSAGPRNCIGMNYAWLEMRAVLSKILRNFELSLEREEDFPQPVNQFIMTSRNGFKVKLARRHHI